MPKNIKQFNDFHKINKFTLYCHSLWLNYKIYKLNFYVVLLKNLENLFLC